MLRCYAALTASKAAAENLVRAQCCACLLSADHYTGITDNWGAGEIYCSEITGRLVVYLLGVKPEFVHVLPMDVPTDVQGIHAAAS